MNLLCGLGQNDSSNRSSYCIGWEMDPLKAIGHAIQRQLLCSIYDSHIIICRPYLDEYSDCYMLTTEDDFIIFDYLRTDARKPVHQRIKVWCLSEPDLDPDDIIKTYVETVREAFK